MVLITRLVAMALAVAVVLSVWPNAGPEAEPAPETSDPRAKLEHSVRAHDRRAGTGSLVLLGDSISRGLSSRDIPNVVNLGLPGDTSAGMLGRLGQYRSLMRANAVVIQVGINDLLRQVPPEVLAENVGSLVRRIPAGTPVYVNPVFPIREAALPGAVSGMIDNAAIGRANALIAGMCRPPTCRLVEIGAMADRHGLRADYDSGDGIHLSMAGYDAWERLLQHTIGTGARAW